MIRQDKTFIFVSVLGALAILYFLGSTITGHTVEAWQPPVSRITNVIIFSFAFAAIAVVASIYIYARSKQE